MFPVFFSVDFFTYGNVWVTTVAVFHENLVNLLAALLHMSSVVKIPHLGYKEKRWVKCTRQITGINTYMH